MFRGIESWRLILCRNQSSTCHIFVSIGYLLVGLVVIITFKDTVLQVPQVRAVLRLLSGPRYKELEGLHLSELPHSEEQCEEEEEQKYSQSICTISSTPLERRCPEVDLS